MVFFIMYFSGDRGQLHFPLKKCGRRRQFTVAGTQLRLTELPRQGSRFASTPGCGSLSLQAGLGGNGRSIDTRVSALNGKGGCPTGVAWFVRIAASEKVGALFTCSHAPATCPQPKYNDYSAGGPLNHRQALAVSPRSTQPQAHVESRCMHGLGSQ